MQRHAHALLVHFGLLRASFKLTIYIFIYALMCSWMDATRSVSLYVDVTNFLMNFEIQCYCCEIETEVVVRWLEVELMRAFEALCGRCCKKRGPRL